MQTNPNLTFLRDNYLSKRILVLQGGTRSGKTFSAIQFLIELCYKYPNAGMVITIARATYPAIRGSVLRDFIDILNSFDAYRVENHNKTESTYLLEGNLIEFISLDQPQKVRGRKRDLLFINECNEITLEGWNQMLFRTTACAVIDFNPSDPMHWIYDEVQTRKDSETLITTYKDNPHLSDVVIAEIERFKDVDPDYWKVYGEGKRSAGRKGQIYTTWQKVQEIDWAECSSITYGVDFGFTNVPTCVVKLGRKNDRRYVEEIVYEKGLTLDLLADRMRKAGIDGGDTLICDSAEPRSITELKRYGFKAIGVKKSKDYKRHAILDLKRLSIFVTANSRNIWEEVTWYAWEMDKDGKPRSPERPIDAFDHSMDAILYANSVKPREVYI